MNEARFAQWAFENNSGEEFHCKKDQVYVLSCGKKTYTWFIKEGVLFTAMQTEHSEGELANSVWRKDNMIHSLDEDIMLPFHALTDCTIVRYVSGTFNSKVKKDPELSWWLAEYYHSQFTRTLSNYRHAALDASEDRLAYLEDMFSQVEELKGERVSDATLALFMGMHRVSVSRIRKKLGNENHCTRNHLRMRHSKTTNQDNDNII